MAYARIATEKDALAMAPRLRAEDLAEMQATVGGIPPAVALSYPLVHKHETYSMIGDDGETVIGMYGVVPALPEVGSVWMMATKDLETPRHAIQFLRQCRAGVDALQERWPLLYNYVDARNTLHIKWLRWCGFTFINRHENYGVEERPFYEFCRIK